ncbi:MAG TPA: mechanosensitive ion channel family protein [Saprospiraceae bacterium]|nr:mechanosensitive ion channel family protein [Saprospiraceae bacterium]HND90023.1 mechanosensitive ion channel family protein [Saprospiraceae bacterium]
MQQDYLQGLLSSFSSFLPTLLLALVTLVVGFWLISWVIGLLNSAFRKRNLEPTVQRFLSSLIGVALKVLLLLSVASMFGIQTTSFIAIFTALAFAIGSALSGSLGHFASGVMVLVFRPYKVGDLVTIAGGQTGTVEEIQMFNTVLMTLDNKKIMIPNGLVTSNIITNISGQGVIRVDMHYAVGNEADMGQVRKAVAEVSAACPQVLSERHTDVFVNGLTPGGTKLLVLPWCKSEHYWDVYFFFQEHIRSSFAKHGIPGPKIEMPSA